MQIVAATRAPLELTPNREQVLATRLSAEIRVAADGTVTVLIADIEVNAAVRELLA